MSTPAVVVKEMSLSRTEFAKSVAALAPATPLAGDSLRLPLGTGHVTIAFEARPPRRLGGLLEMPQALVSLAFEGVGEEDATRFLHRFDIAFQRGGG
jgi:hypothetical protein